MSYYGILNIKALLNCPKNLVIERKHLELANYIIIKNVVVRVIRAIQNFFVCAPIGYVTF